LESAINRGIGDILTNQATMSQQVNTNTEDIEGLTEGVTETSIKAIMADGFIRNSVYPFDGQYATMASLSAANRLMYRNAVLDVKIHGADKTKRYGLNKIKRHGSGGEWSIEICEFNADFSVGTTVATFYSTTYVEPTNGIDILPISQYSSSGITGYIMFDWLQITDGSLLQFTGANKKESMLDKRTSVLSFAVPGVDVVLPPTIYNVVDRETNIYFDNVILCDNLNNYQIDITCSIGQQLNECWRTDGAAGTNALTLSVYKDSYLVAKTVTSVVSKAATVGNGVNRRCLVIGDSTTAGGEIVTELNVLAAADVMDLNFIGTKGSGANLHEGISGWSVHAFYTDVTSPFVSAGVFDFAAYMTANSYADLDHLIINLGINDVGNYTDDVALYTKIATILTELEAMITNIHAYDADIKIGLCVSIPPSYNQDSFGDDYFTGQTRWRAKRNHHLWAKKLIGQFTGRTAELIYLVPIDTNIDIVNNMQYPVDGEGNPVPVPVNARNTAITVVRQNNGVHPALTGYYQIADVIWAYLKSFEV
jgi:lysophospholipase L1-like esterase